MEGVAVEFLGGLLVVAELTAIIKSDGMDRACRGTEDIDCSIATLSLRGISAIKARREVCSTNITKKPQ